MRTRAVNVWKPRLAVAVIGLSALVCAQGSDDAAIRQFGEAYVAAREALGKAEVSSYVVVLGSREVTGHDDYWSHLKRALKSNDPADSASAADEALAAYAGQTQPLRDEFDESIESLHRSVLGLLEAANRIRDAALRGSASDVAGALTRAHRSLQQMNVNMGRRFRLQLAVLDDLRSGKGIARVVLARPKDAQEVADLSAAIDKGRVEEQEAANDAAQNYARLRGLTNVVLPDPLPEREGQAR
jgi:hypothetical protein